MKPRIMSVYNCILYDNENMRFYNAFVQSISGSSYADGYLNCEMGMSINNSPIELDPTTMKRIAKYNKEIELNKLNNDIEKAKIELKHLKEEKQELSNKLKAISIYLEEEDGAPLVNVLEKETWC